MSNKLKYMCGVAKSYAKENGSCQVRIGGVPIKEGSNIYVGGVIIEEYKHGYPAVIGKLFNIGRGLQLLPIKTIQVNFCEVAQDVALKEVKDGIPYVKFRKHKFYYHRGFGSWFKNLSVEAFKLYFNETLDGIL